MQAQDVSNYSEIHLGYVWPAVCYLPARGLQIQY